MGRILDLCNEVAVVAEEGPEGLVLDEGDRQRFLESWTEDDIDDALSLVQDNLLQSELVEAADSLNNRLIEYLGEFGEAVPFSHLAAGEGVMGPEVASQIARRVARIEEVLSVFREGALPDRSDFDALRERLADYGIEDEMEESRFDPDEPN